MSFPRISVSLGMAAAAALILHPAGAQTLPNDAQPTCAIPPGNFAAMFVGNTVTLNGVVRPADSTVNLTNNCAFFTWSEQMFLWLTSPAPQRYGGGSRIMFSPAFYTASPPIPDANEPDPDNWRRNFMRNQANARVRMGLRATELGPHHRPIVISRSGQVLEVSRPDPRRAPPVVRLRTGALAPLANVRRSPAGELQFFDPRGRALQVRRAALPPVPRTMIRMQDGRRLPLIPAAAVRDVVQARRFLIRDIPVFLDASNNVIDVEPGQADGGVLLSQNGSLIFYIITVNDVFAFHRTMQGAALIPPGTTLQFPLNMADANAVVAFAAGHQTAIVDPEALAIETKSSWVEASAVANPNDYIRVEARIPTFNTSNGGDWVPNGEKNATLVMVGLHVVGSTLNHGEMLWATFEHFGNAPNADYDYNSTTGLKTVAQNTVGTWVFTPNGSAGPFNQMTAHWDITTGHILGGPVGTQVAPSAVLRLMPWGTEGSNAALNTQVISANASVINQLAPGDVRRNYLHGGTIWAFPGQQPTPPNQTGTKRLANATIETFAQASMNCFSCHHTNRVAVSHIYRQMNPLF